MLETQIVVVGGGLAGLATAISLQKLGLEVLLIERNKYPFHRVCGEYISLESMPFLQRLGIDFPRLQLPIINKLRITAPSGTELNAPLPLGGFGISRYKLDALLVEVYKSLGGQLLESTTVERIERKNDGFIVTTQNEIVNSNLVAAAFGKRSHLGKIPGLHPEKKSPAGNFIGVKYHVIGNLPSDIIELHSFPNGYCGISQVEDGIHCLCYLTTAANLQAGGGKIVEMEKLFLHQNPILATYLTEFPKLWEKPISIAQISFDRRPLIRDGVFALGDAAGMITPLCGNGMSMALRAGHEWAPLAHQFLQRKITRHQLETQYNKTWESLFSTRLLMGRALQHILLKSSLAPAALKTISAMPFSWQQGLIGLTHGQRY